MRIKMLILDVDGVLTDGRKAYSNKGVETKQFNDKDFTAIKRFSASGVKVVFLSGDENINKSIASSRNIDFYYARLKTGVISKASFLSRFENFYKIDRKDMAYVGDDLFDLDIIKALDLTFCPKDAIKDIKEACLKVLDKNGGDGVVVELYNYAIDQNLINSCELEAIKKLDSCEKY